MVVLVRQHCNTLCIHYVNYKRRSKGGDAYTVLTLKGGDAYTVLTLKGGDAYTVLTLKGGDAYTVLTLTECVSFPTVAICNVVCNVMAM